MRLLAGTSGYSYDEWKGSFYPAELKSGEMLGYYAARLPTVEINNTFYRMPRVEVVAAWAEQVPEDFRFVLKAARRITHQQRLKDSLDSVAYLFKVAAILGDKLGAVLFQLPPNMKKDVTRLRDFLAVLPEDCRAAFEFRHDSWFSDDVYSVLTERGAALCGGDVEEEAKSPPLVATANWGYLRLRRNEYTEAELAAWAGKIASQRWQNAYVFIKHEVKAPSFAATLTRCFTTGAAAALTMPDLARTRPPQPELAKTAPKRRPARKTAG
jgi:uncharacterized protein YecE (DUF72 family)